MNMFSIYIYTCPVNIVISTAQTDLGLRSRTFSLKLNKLPTSLKCGKIVFKRSDELTY